MGLLDVSDLTEAISSERQRIDADIVGARRRDDALEVPIELTDLADTGRRRRSCSHGSSAGSRSRATDRYAG